jgi:hypothetical protein
MRRTTSFVLAALATLVASGALAQRPIDSLWTGKEAVTPDGDLEEWSNDNSQPVVPFVLLGRQEIVAGAGPYDGPDDVAAEIGFAHNAKALFAAIKVTDDVFVRRDPRVTIDDHVELWFAAPKKGGGFDVRGIGLFPDPTRAPATVDVLAVEASPEKVGGKIPGAKAGIRVRGTQYDLEVAIPWKAIPGGAKGRRELKVLAFVVDSDAPDVLVHETILGTGLRSLLGSPADMPALLQSDIGASLRAFNESVGLPRDLLATYVVAANICGSRAKEEVDAVDKYLVVLGCNPVSGQFYYHDTPVEGGYGILSLDAAPLLGNGRDALIVRYGRNEGGADREWVEIYSIGDDGVFTGVFAALMAVRAADYTIENAFKIVPGGKAKAIVVSATKVEGTLPLMAPILDGNEMVTTKKPVKFKYDGTRYTKE